MDLFDPCARWFVFSFTRVQFSWKGQNDLFSSVILPLCFLTVKTAKPPIKSGVSVGASILCNPFGGEGGIRTLDELLTHTRVPVVRLCLINPIKQGFIILIRHFYDTCTGFSQNFIFLQTVNKAEKNYSISGNITQIPLAPHKPKAARTSAHPHG